jgi:hypothetical protein
MIVGSNYKRLLQGCRGLAKVGSSSKVVKVSRHRFVAAKSQQSQRREGYEGCLAFHLCIGRLFWIRAMLYLPSFA